MTHCGVLPAKQGLLCSADKMRDKRPYSSVIRGTGSGRVRPTFESPLYHFLAMGPWTSYFISLGLSFCICKMSIIIVSTLESYH